MRVMDYQTGLERMTISASRYYPVASATVAVLAPAERPPTVPADLPSRLALRDGQAVYIYGDGDHAVIAGVVDGGRALVAAPESADLVLYWPATQAELAEELPRLAHALRPGAQLWVIAAQPGNGAGETIHQREILASGRAAGLMDSRVAFLSDHEYGYRFSRWDD
ncbi:MAG: hypothetical protein KatS3mg061_0740 [Dehalococcoidia bacterium]|nr:MAG: hypothetical protein KatS3mg061_0740 [Dehalococcoidia bacterium]